MRPYLLALSSALLAILGGWSCHAPSGGGGGGAAGAGGGGALFDAGDLGAAPMGCVDAGLAPTSDAAIGCEGVEAGVAYQRDVAPIFNQRCSGEICHGPPTWQSTVGMPSTECCDRKLVTPGDLEHSYLADKILDLPVCSGGPMPLSGAPLTEAEITTIVRWICEGAPND